MFTFYFNAGDTNKKIETVYQPSKGDYITFEGTVYEILRTAYPDNLDVPVLLCKEVKEKNTGKPSRSIRERKIDFVKDILSFANSFPNKYPKLLYKEFVSYWTESKAGRMRFEKEPVFEVPRRLATFKTIAVERGQLQAYRDKDALLPALNEVLRSLFDNPTNTTPNATTEKSN